MGEIVTENDVDVRRAEFQEQEIEIRKNTHNVVNNRRRHDL